MEKIQDITLPPPTSSSSSSSSSSSAGALSFLTTNAVSSSLSKAYQAFSQRRAALGLKNPGNFEGVAKEIQREVFLNNYMFSGFRADLTKALSSSPTFQTAHNFTMSAPGMRPYTYVALYGTAKTFLQANIDNDLTLSGLANYKWTPSFVTKSNVQLQPGGAQSMVQLETEYTGSDFSLGLKAMNPSIIDGPLTGVFVGHYLQSVTPKLALGLETIFQRASADEGPVTALSYALRYKSADWIGTAQYNASGAISTSYWRRLAERVEAGADLTVQAAGLASSPGVMGPMGSFGSEAVATLGAKYEFRTAIFRGQIDSKRKVSCLLEKTLSPIVGVTFAGELDHAKNAAKVGLAISVSSVPEEMMEQQQMQERMGGLDPVTPPM